MVAAPPPPSSHPAPEPAFSWRTTLGPGFVVAATGVGAGDLIAASIAGSRYGLAVLWVALLGALFKWVLNEGVARWQLATGTTLLEGWNRHLPRSVSWYFIAYLLLWSVLVAAALASACGVAARALWPVASTSTWAIIHATAGFALVWIGRYRVFERIMTTMMIVMFIAVIGCALVLRPDVGAVFSGLLIPTVPAGSAKFLLGVMGGVGGSVTLLCYGYWIRERGWQGPAARRRTSLDLGVAYFFSGLFGVAMIVIAAGAQPADASGSALVLALAARLGELFGDVGRWLFLVGFWCAVFTSLLGVWQGVPYLFADSWRLRGRHHPDIPAPNATDPAATTADLATTPAYRWFLAFLAFPPLMLLWFDRPLLLIVIYAVSGAFFMPFLAAVLLRLNNRRAFVGTLKNGRVINLLLVLSLSLFACLFVFEAVEQVAAWRQAR